MEQTIVESERLAQARALVASLEIGDDAEATRIIKSFPENMEVDLFQEVGRLTRELHEAIIGFAMDDKVMQAVQHEMPDAAERLTYVIEMTENAANTTLKAVEDSMPVSEELAQISSKLAAEWGRFRGRQMELEDFRALSEEIGSFLTLASGHSAILNSNLSEILLAQGYQDITGQIIRRVIALIQEVEERLVRLVAISGTARVQEIEKAEVEMAGPAVPNIEQGNMVNSQDDVDDLLSSLGF